MVYLVTDGDYSDYHIKAIFSTRELAEAYKAKRAPDGYIEEYELDTASSEVLRTCYACHIWIEDGSIREWSFQEWALPTTRARNVAIGSVGASAYSYVSPKHARKLAIEARQAYLREHA